MSYHEGSNWQARKEDEGKPLYENEKKAIPKQAEPSTGSEEDGLPDIYKGELNERRIKEYQKLRELFGVDEGTIRGIFSAGADFYKSLLTTNKT